MPNETIFTMDTTSLKLGAGATREIGADMVALGVKRVMVVTDPHLVDLPPVHTVRDALHAQGIDPVLYDQVQVEPTDQSFKAAIAFATAGNFDGYIAVGGGSVM